MRSKRGASSSSSSCDELEQRERKKLKNLSMTELKEMAWERGLAEHQLLPARGRSSKAPIIAAILASPATGAPLPTPLTLTLVPKQHGQTTVFRSVLRPDIRRRITKGDLISEDDQPPHPAGPGENDVASRPNRNPWAGSEKLLESILAKRGVRGLRRHPYIHCILPRGPEGKEGTRLDAVLTETGRRHLLDVETRQFIKALVEKRKQEAQYTGGVSYEMHLFFVLPGAPAQDFHRDASTARFYTTLLFPLTV